MGYYNQLKSYNRRLYRVYHKCNKFLIRLIKISLHTYNRNVTTMHLYIRRRDW